MSIKSMTRRRRKKKKKAFSSSDLSQHCRASSNRIVKKCNIVIVSSLNIVERSSIFQMIRLNRLFWLWIDVWVCVRKKKIFFSSAFSDEWKKEAEGETERSGKEAEDEEDEGKRSYSSLININFSFLFIYFRNVVCCYCQKWDLSYIIENSMISFNDFTYSNACRVRKLILLDFQLIVFDMFKISNSSLFLCLVLFSSIQRSKSGKALSIIFKSTSDFLSFESKKEKKFIIFHLIKQVFLANDS